MIFKFIVLITVLSVGGFHAQDIIWDRQNLTSNLKSHAKAQMPQVEAQRSAARHLARMLEEQRIAQQQFPQWLINDLKELHNLSFFDNPMISIYVNLCDEQSASSTQHSLEQICNVVVQSEECKKVEEKEDLLDCSRPAESKSFDTMEFIIGCGKGLWNTVVEFFNFLLTIIRNAVDAPEEFMEYLESAKLYLVNEYDKAYEEAESFKTITAIKAVAHDLGGKIFHAIQEMAKNEYTEFGCLNFMARTKKICTLIGAFVDPFVFLKVLKLGKHAYHAIAKTNFEIPSSKTIKKARKKLGLTKKEFKAKNGESKQQLSQYHKDGDVEKGHIEVEYINRDGGVEKAWAENIDGGSIKLESRMHRVSNEQYRDGFEDTFTPGKTISSNQVLSVTRHAEGLKDYNLLRQWLDEGNVPVNKIRVHGDWLFGGEPRFHQWTPDGVRVKRSLPHGEVINFLHKRDIEGVSIVDRVKNPLPVSSGIDPKVRAFRDRFNGKRYAFENPEERKNLFVSLDYMGEKRLGMIQKQDIESSLSSSSSLRVTLKNKEGDTGKETTIRIDGDSSSDRKTLESIAVNDEAYRQMGNKYSIEDMPMTASNAERNVFRQAFNSGSLTSAVRYVEHNGHFYEITAIDKKSGLIRVRHLDEDVDGPREGVLSSHQLDDVHVSKEVIDYVKEMKDPDF